MQEKVISKANEALIQAYLEIVASDDYKDLALCSPMTVPFRSCRSGTSLRAVRKSWPLLKQPGTAETHDEQSKSRHQELFTDGDFLCVEYEHALIINALHVRTKIDGYCLVFHFRDGKFDAVREYINRLSTPLGVFYGHRPEALPAHREAESTAQGVKST